MSAAKWLEATPPHAVGNNTADCVETDLFTVVSLLFFCSYSWFPYNSYQHDRRKRLSTAKIVFVGTSRNSVSGWRKTTWGNCAITGRLLYFACEIILGLQKLTHSQIAQKFEIWQMLFLLCGTLYAKMQCKYYVFRFNFVFEMVGFFWSKKIAIKSIFWAGIMCAPA